MRTALVLAVALLARTASAQPRGPADPAPTTPASGPGLPLPMPLPADPAPPPADPAPQPTAPSPAADPDYGGTPDQSVHGADDSLAPGTRRGRDIVVRYIPSRPTKNITMLALLAGGGALFGAVGLYYHLDSRTLSDDISAKTYTGNAWTVDRQAAYDDAHQSAGIARIAYGIGGAFLVTTAILYIVTEPKQQEIVITPHTKARPTAAIIAPTGGGALFGGAWSF